MLNGKPSFETSSLVTDARMSRARGPQSPTVHQRRGEVVDPRAVVQVVGEPLLVGHAVRAAGDDAEDLVVHPHDRQVGLEVAARREHRRVDDAADRHVHLPRRDLLHDVERARPDDVEDAERGQVEHRGAVAHREVLRVDDRRPPARVPLVLARLRRRTPRRAARSTRTTAAAPTPPPRRRRRRAPARARRTATGGRRGSTPTARPGGRSRTSC